MDIFLIFFTALSSVIVCNDAFSFQPEVTLLPTDLTPFAKYVYQFIYPDIYEKIFDSNLTPEEAARGWYASPMFVSRSLGLMDAGTLPLEISRAAEQAFSSGHMTKMAYFKVLANTAEGQLSNILNPSNTPTWAKIYSSLLIEALQGEEYTTSEFRIYAMSVAHVKLEKYLDYTLDDVKAGMRKIRDEFLNAANSKIYY